METNRETLETLSEKIHHLYCEQYFADNGKYYWTEGDYSKLDERTKEYDRNIARFILKREAELLERIAQLAEPPADMSYEIGSYDHGRYTVRQDIAMLIRAHIPHRNSEV